MPAVRLILLCATGISLSVTCSQSSAGCREPKFHDLTLSISESKRVELPCEAYLKDSRREFEDTEKAFQTKMLLIKGTDDRGNQHTLIVREVADAGPLIGRRYRVKIKDMCCEPRAAHTCDSSGVPTRPSWLTDYYAASCENNLTEISDVFEKVP